MKLTDIFSYAFSGIRLRKLRAGLTTLGVVIGIAAIVALLSITQGLQDTITQQLQTGFATDTLIVASGQGFGAAFDQGANGGLTGSSLKLLINYTEVINELSPDIDTSIAIVQRVVNLTSGERERHATIVGIDFAVYADIYSSTFVAESGDIPLNPQEDALVVGKRVSDPWSNTTLFCSVNDTVVIEWINATTPLSVRIETYTGHVAAVLGEVGGFGAAGPSDFSVYIPISKAETFFGTDECDMIVVKLKNDDETTIESVSDAIKEAFGNQVSVVSATAVLSILSSVFSVIELFLAGIAAISLLVAGVGIMNIMIVSLIERTREIGILKALGMKGRTVLLIFLGESVIIGLIGAVIGIASGWGLANVVAMVFRGGGGLGIRSQAPQAETFGSMAITPVLTPIVLMGALVFGVGVSVVFALYPAWRASKLKPVEALRYE